MKYLVDICLIIAMLMIVYMAEGWWALFALMPFCLLLLRYGPDQPVKSKKGTPGFESKGYAYDVTSKEGEIINVKCLCPVQFSGKWAHFTNEITEFGYHPHASLYKPRYVKEVEEKADSQTH